MEEVEVFFLCRGSVEIQYNQTLTEVITQDLRSVSGTYRTYRIIIGAQNIVCLVYVSNSFKKNI